MLLQGVGKGEIQECAVAPNCFSSTASDEHYLKLLVSNRAAEFDKNVANAVTPTIEALDLPNRWEATCNGGDLSMFGWIVGLGFNSPCITPTSS